MEESEPSGESSLKDILAELGLKNIQIKGRELEVDPEFASRLDEICHSLFESPHLSATFASELKYGFGHAMGYKMVDWIWEQMTPSMKPSSPGAKPSDLRLMLPLKQREKVTKLIRKVALDFNGKTGVILPSVKFEDGKKLQMFWRSVELTKFDAYPSPSLIESVLLTALVKNAWRLLSVKQVQDKLHRLWSEKPELQQAAQADGLGVMGILRFLRDLLKAGHSIREFDLIVETIVLYRPYDLASLADEAKEELLSVVGQTSSGPSVGKASTGRETTSAQELMNVDRVMIAVGRHLLDLIAPQGEAPLLERVTSVRRTLATDLGWMCPAIRFRDDLTLDVREFRISVRGVEMARGLIYPNYLFALGPTDRLDKIRGIEAHDPTFGMPGKWVEPKQRDECENLGCAIFEPVSVLATCLVRTLRREAHRLLSHQDFHESLIAYKDENKALSELVEDSPILFRQAKTVFCRLLEEQVPVIDRTAILETLLELEESELSPYFLTERVREVLGPLVCRDHVRMDKDLYAMTLSAEVEALCREYLKSDAKQARFQPDSETEETLLSNIEETVQELIDEGHSPVLVTPSCLRRPLRDFLKERLPDLFVLAESEVQGDHSLVVLAEVPIRKLTPQVIKHRPLPRELRSGQRFKKGRKRIDS